MASKPGILSEWPWTSLGSFKYAILAPSAIHSTYSFFSQDKNKRDVASLLILPFLLWRMLHNQIWITISRYQTAKGISRIVDKGIEFDQVDRERNWDDQILLNGILYYLVIYSFPRASQLPWWNSDGIVMAILLHAGPVEFLYYWLHRALHHHYLYSRYHSHHHSSIVTEPITYFFTLIHEIFPMSSKIGVTSVKKRTFQNTFQNGDRAVPLLRAVIHPFAEHIAYFLLFAIPMLTTVFTRTASMAVIFGYVTYIDFMNNMGHCNFELIPNWLFNVLPPLKYIMYTPSFHSLHHTQFRTNYSLFMPFYDYLYGTMDKSCDQLHQSTLKREEDSPDVVHLTHLTTLQSIYHLRLGFASLASKPQCSEWYLWLMWPFTLWSLMLTWVYGHTFIVESNRFKKLGLQTWVVPKYNIQYLMEWQKEPINRVIEEAILDAERKGTKVLSLGLLNQGEELNTYGELYVKRNPKLKVKVVDGSCLAAAIVINSIPKGTTQVLFRGKLNKFAYAIAFTLCQKGILVATMHEDEYVKLKKSFNNMFESKLIISRSYSQTTWLVGDGLTEEEQLKAPKGTSFIPYTQFPQKKYREDCTYHYTPAMLTPMSLENLHSCENWLPRRVMSAWRIAGIVHALEGWKEHECGYTMLNMDKVWQATLLHGFQPISEPTQ